MLLYSLALFPLFCVFTHSCALLCTLCCVPRLFLCPLLTFKQLHSLQKEETEGSGIEPSTPTESEKGKKSVATKAQGKLKKKTLNSSSFVQNLLYEDSCAGVTVIDLFIALKSIKENLDFLSNSNDIFSYNVNYLNEETEIVWRDFVDLLESMKTFLDKMNADISVFNLNKLEEKYLKAETTNEGNTEEEIKYTCAECGKDLDEIISCKKLRCPGCIIMAIKEKAVKQCQVLPEAFLGSFIASVLCWQKEQESARTKRSSATSLNEKASDGSLNIKESTVQMICDICEILNGATTREELIQTVQEDTDDDACWSSGVSTVSRLSNVKYGKNKTGESSKAVESKGELTSEGDSEFEEAISCQLNHSTHNVFKAKPSVTCMGDLSKGVGGKKSVSTLTPSNIVTSWAGNLSDEIKSKIKEIKSKRQNKTKIRVFEKPFDKSESALKKRPGMLQFSVTASTSAGVFDVTVVQYKKPRCIRKSSFSYKKNSHSTNTTRASAIPPLLREYKDDFWSEESLGNSETESVETCSNFGDDDMGEFLEVYVQNKSKINSVPEQKVPLMAKLTKMELKTGKPNFSQMHECFPVYFIQEFVRKLKKQQQNQQQHPGPEDRSTSTGNNGNNNSSNSSNNSDNNSDNRSNNSEEEIISLNSGERQEKQIVIPGNSSDVVIYIQLEIEDDLKSSSNRLVLDYEKSSLGTQTKDSRDESYAQEKVIRLREEEQKGESLFNIWRAEEMTLPVEDDMERITFEEPLIVIDKPDDEEQEGKWKKNRKRVVSFRENLSDMLDEKEITETTLEEEKVMGKAEVLIIKDLKQTAPIWYNQIAKRWKREYVKQKPKVPKEVIDSINSSAGELKKALRLIREIENDIVDAQIDDAISILPRLEIELRKHLHIKMKGLDEKEAKNRLSIDNFFSSLDLGLRDDSIGGDSDESSEYRFNNLLKLLSNLEDAVKASEHANNRIELAHYDSSKIYGLLHALTDNIRELEEGPNLNSLSQTLDIASRLDTAIREYDSIVKKQPVDYLTLQERSRKRRKPRWSPPEEAAVSQHLKNVRKKVFEIVEMEAVGMEERIERDFDRLDRLESENDEAMAFLEALLQKTQRRMSEFQNLKTALKDRSSSLNSIYENFMKAEEQKKKIMEKNMGKVSVGSGRSPDRSSRITGEEILVKISRSSGRSPDKESKLRKSSESPERDSEKSSERSSRSLERRIPHTVSRSCGRSPENLGMISDKSSEQNERRNSESSEKSSERIPDTASGSSERPSESFGRDYEKTSSSSEYVSETSSGRITDKTSEQSEKRNSYSSENSSEKILNSVSRSSAGSESVESFNKKTNRKTSSRGSDRSLDRVWEKSSDGSNQKMPSSDNIPVRSSRSSEKTSPVVSKRVESSEEGSGRNSERTERSQSSKRVSSSEKMLEKEKSSEIKQDSKSKKLSRSSRKVTERKLDRISEKSSEMSSGTDEEKKPEENVAKITEKSFKKVPPEDPQYDSPLSTPPSDRRSAERIADNFAKALDQSKTTEAPPTDHTPVQLTSILKEFKVIGESSLYLAWTDPEGLLEGSITGYEIHVDGKLNQKVRNPQRVQAVLYSVDLSKKIQVQLYAVVDNHLKILLSTMDVNAA